MIMKAFDALSRVVLGGGALSFGLWGLLGRESLGEMMGAGEGAASAVGVRDLGSGPLIAPGSGSGPYLLRALYDAGDAARMRQDHPKAAPGALAFGALALVQAHRRRGRS